MITRTSKHILKYSNKEKLKEVEEVYNNYKVALQECINLIISKELPLKTFLSCKQIPILNNIEAGDWKGITYKQASEIVRSIYKKNSGIRFKRYKKVYSYFLNKNRMKEFTSKKFSEINLKQRFYIKPNVENCSINLDYHLFNIEESNKCFNEFVRVKTVRYKMLGKRRVLQTIKLPIKQHKQSLKFKDWKRKNTIQLSKIKNNFYITFFYENIEKPLKKEGKELGLDVGYKKLVSLSDGRFIGSELEELYIKLSRATRNSKNYKQLLTQRNNLVDKCINSIGLGNVKTLVIEDLKGLKANTFNKETGCTSRTFRNKSQYALYTQVEKKLTNKCIEHGVKLVKVSPKYTSQKCSKCNVIDKSSRKGELYKCKHCGLVIDADYNASINILNRGVYSPSDTLTQ